MVMTQAAFFWAEEPGRKGERRRRKWSKE